MTGARWQQTFYLDRLYAIFRVAPFGSPLLCAVKKVRKRNIPSPA